MQFGNLHTRYGLIRACVRTCVVYFHCIVAHPRSLRHSMRWIFCSGSIRAKIFPLRSEQQAQLCSLYSLRGKTNGEPLVTRTKINNCEGI